MFSSNNFTFFHFSPAAFQRIRDLSGVDANAYRVRHPTNKQTPSCRPPDPRPLASSCFLPFFPFPSLPCIHYHEFFGPCKLTKPHLWSPHPLQVSFSWLFLFWMPSLPARCSLTHFVHSTHPAGFI